MAGQGQSTFPGMDDETANVILQLQLQDVSRLSETAKDERRQGNLSNFEVALRVQGAELCSGIKLIWDRMIAESFDPRGITTSILLRTAELPQGYAANRQVPVRQDAASSQTPLQSGSGISSGNLGSGSTAASGNSDDQTEESNVKKVTCVSCSVQMPEDDIAKVECSHSYCRDCVRQLFSLSLVDETLFPPRCCRRVIVPDKIEEFLTSELIRGYKDKKVESDTVDKTYCSDPTCSTFLKPGHIVGHCGTCPVCKKGTCTKCKFPSHESSDCPEDDGAKEVLEMAKALGWQQCRSCKTMVSITVGCNHMICRCKNHWCYVCGIEWKKCTCPFATEDLLYARAGEIAAREAPQPGVTRRERIDAIADRLRVHCEHSSGWAFVRGAHNCENCSAVMPDFIKQCYMCRTRWCKRCTLNRAS